METIEVHSKDFVLRWVHVSPGSRITWKVTPTKKSINFGVYARGGTDMDSRTILQTMSQTAGTIRQRLETAGCVPLAYNGIVRLEAREALEGAAHIEQGHMVVFIFDNTFSKNLSKHVELSFSIEDQHSRAHEAAAAANVALYSRDSVRSTSRTHLDETTGLPAHKGTASGSQPSTPQLTQAQQQFPEVLQGAALSSTPSLGHRDRASSNLSTNTDADSDSTRTAPAPLRQRQSTLSNSGGNDHEPVYSIDGRYVTGFLSKKRRKQFQGFARRFFSLDKKMGLLNYYLNARSRSLRGVMPLRIADVSTDPKTLQITLDSGMEKWTLKASGQASFEAWKREFLEVRAQGIQETDSETESEPTAFTSTAAVTDVSHDRGYYGSSSAERAPAPDSSSNPEVLNELNTHIKSLPTGLQKDQLESIYARLAATDASRGSNSPGDRTPRPVATTHPSSATLTTSKRFQNDPSALPVHSVQGLLTVSKPGYVLGAVVGMLVGSLLGSFVVLLVVVTLSSTLGGALYLVANPHLLYKDGKQQQQSRPYPGSVFGTGEHEKSTETLSSGGESQHRSLSEDEDDLSDNSDVEELATTSKHPVPYTQQKPRHTAKTDSASTRQVKHDQLNTEYETEDPEVAAVFRRMVEKYKQSHVEQAKAAEAEATEALSKDVAAIQSIDGVGLRGPNDAANAATAAASSVAVGGGLGVGAAKEEEDTSAETSLYPLPHSKVHRRTNIKGPSQPPPSLLSMLKKAQGGQMVAPVTANEPLSGLQSTAEIFENSSLLDAASHAPPGSHLRVILVAVFAVARLAGVRCKERALRKPFTPLLGETYELVREDRGLRFISEKVMHKPEVVATQTESPHWTVHFTSRPHTKMWAKTVQITDVGHFNVTFPDGESVSYINPELFIRNIIAGERYIDPSGTFTVESSAGSHATATVEFKAKGMFGGRSEEVKISCGDLVYEGKWTEAIYNKGKLIWSAKPLVADAQAHFGLPVFAAQLNETTPIEHDALPPNDSRLRPDIRDYENQKVDKAEELKLRIEQHQRERRKELEIAGKHHEPFFFVKSNDEKGYYMLQEGEKNYWVRRQKQNWSEIPNWFQ